MYGVSFRRCAVISVTVQQEVTPFTSGEELWIRARMREPRRLLRISAAR